MADAVAKALGEPEVAVRSSRNPIEAATRGEAGAKLGDAALGRDTADSVSLGEPDVAVWPGRDAGGPAGDPGSEHAKATLGRDAADGTLGVDPGGDALGEPEVAVRTGRNVLWEAAV